MLVDCLTLWPAPSQYRVTRIVDAGDMTMARWGDGLVLGLAIGVLSVASAAHAQDITDMKKGEGGSAVQGSSGPGGAQGATSDLERCDKPMGAVAVVEPQDQIIYSLARYKLGSPSVVTADYMLTPSVVFSQDDAGGVGAGIGGMFGTAGRVFGAVAGGLQSTTVATLARGEELIFMGKEEDGFVNVETSKGGGWVKKVLIAK
jgi:hypothetical protein